MILQKCRSMSSEMLRAQVEQQFGVRPRARASDSDTRKRDQVSVIIQYSTAQYSTVGPGQRDYSVTKIFNILFPSLTTRQNKSVLLTIRATYCPLSLSHISQRFFRIDLPAMFKLQIDLCTGTNGGQKWLSSGRGRQMYSEESLQDVG